METKLLVVKKGDDYMWIDDELSLYYGFPPFRVKKEHARKFPVVDTSYVWVDDDLSLYYGFPPLKVKREYASKFQLHVEK